MPSPQRTGLLADPDTQTPRLRIEPLDISLGLRKQACEAIKRAITEMDIYGQPEDGCEPKLCDQAAACGDSFGWLRLAGASVLAAIPAQ